MGAAKQAEILLRLGAGYSNKAHKVAVNNALRIRRTGNPITFANLPLGCKSSVVVFFFVPLPFKRFPMKDIEKSSCFKAEHQKRMFYKNAAIKQETPFQRTE